MTTAEGQQPHSQSQADAQPAGPEPSPTVRLDEDSAARLEAARAFAGFTGFTETGCSHIALALLSDEQSFLDSALKELFDGLRAATVTDSLLDILQRNAAPSPDPPAETATEAATETATEAATPEGAGLTPQALEALRRAGAVAAARGAERVGVRALAAGLFESPDEFLVAAFDDAGVKTSELAALSEHLAATITPDGQVEQTNHRPTIFVEGAPSLEASGPVTQGSHSAEEESQKNFRLNFEAFGPVTQGALRALAGVAAAAADRNLRDTDLLFCLVSQKDSLLNDALHVLGANVKAVRRYLEAQSGEAATPAAELPEARVSRLLRSVFEAAAALAAREGCALVSESQLVRAHLDRVAGASGSLYQRLGINTAALRDYLNRYISDREVAGKGKRDDLIEDIEGYLLSRVLGQGHAVSAVVPSVKRMRSGLRKRGKPLGMFLFLGPTGVGKTELALAIADVAFGKRNGTEPPPLIKLDCGNFVTKHDIYRLIGAPQGYVGYKEGQLTNELREKPKSLILFDEAEKADPAVWQSLLALFDKGVVSEADGTQYDATGCIIVATSNKGYKEAMQRFDLWQETPEEREAVQDAVEKFVWDYVQEYFSPEFRGRFGRENIIYFHHFDRETYRGIVALQVNRLVEDMRSAHQLEVTVKPEVIDFLAGEAWAQREEGARPVERLVLKHLDDQLDEAHMEEPGRKDFTFAFEHGSGRVVLEG